MWIREVDLPLELIAAHRAGRLVLFVGAGASVDAPASLPLFGGLTSAIASEAGVPLVEGYDRFDVFLGRLKDQGVDVHKRVAEHIGETTSRPNALHRALVDLALASPLPFKIVTTNFDLHLSQALTEAGASFDEYAGPALPVGSDFTGIVYLHGSLLHDSKRLVVTDEDFGRAYLRDAWAARFLERMFASYTVLFVGYSHNDIVMQYLARSLVSGQTRYVLTDNQNKTDWRPLRLIPATYPICDGSHAALGDAIAKWAANATMGLLDHRQRIAQLVSSPPQLIPEESSYLESVIEDADQVRLFTELARGREWLKWAATKPIFRSLFDPSTQSSELTSSLAWWFAQEFVMKEEYTQDALRVVNDVGGRLAPVLWSAVGHSLHMQGSPRPDWLAPWLVLLVQNVSEFDVDWLEYALLASRWPKDRTAALMLFDHLTEPRARMRSSYVHDSGPWFDVTLAGSEYELSKAWNSLFLPNLGQVAPDVLAVVDRHLRRAFQLMMSAGATPSWEPMSRGRSAIETHSQDSHRESVDALIDAARDSIEAVLDDGSSLGDAYVDAWAASGIPILQRLAIHAWTHRSDRDHAAKVGWLIERGWIFEHSLRHEVFRLIEVAIPLAPAETADALVADILVAPVGVDDEERCAYVRFNALTWINRHAPGLESARAAIEKIRFAYPNFEERDHPDLLSRLEFGVVQPKPPMTSAELHVRIAEDASAVLVELRQYEGREFFEDGPRWQDALDVIVETVRENPDDGFAILDALVDEQRDVIGAVVSGWSSVDVDSAVAERILLRLTEVELAGIANELSQLLADGGTDAHPTEWHAHAAARKLAVALWDALVGVRADADPDDSLMYAINSPAGKVALFWVHSISADWKTAGEGWAGLSSESRIQLEDMLASADARSACAETVFASQLFFFFAADRSWCEGHILPLLDWGNPRRARRAWDGYLTWGRFNDALLAAGLLDHYLEAARHSSEVKGDHRRQLFSHLAEIALGSEVDPSAWLPRLTSQATLECRVEWMNQVAWMLDGLKAEDVEQQWKRWMRTYWRDRLRSIPRELSVDEGSAMAAWVIYLTQSLDEGIKLSIEGPAGLGGQEKVLHKLDADKLRRSPAGFAKMITHLLAGTDKPFWGCYRLEKIIAELRGEVDAADLANIVEQAHRLGCQNAMQWLG